MAKEFREIKDMELTELSLVDKPAQELAVAAIEKSKTKEGDMPDTNAQTPDVAALQAQVDLLMKMQKMSAKEKAYHDSLDDEGKRKAFMDMDEEGRKKAMGNFTTKAEDEVARLAQIVSLDAVSKAHYDGLDDAGRTSFLALDATARTDAIRKAAENAASSDPVVYKSDDGTEIRKSHGDIALHQARQLDELRKQNLALNASMAYESIQKRAREEFANFPGDLDLHTTVVKALDGIADEAHRKGAFELVKAGNTALAKSSVTLGTNAGSNEGTASADANAKLEKMVSEYADQNKVSRSEAYMAVWNQNPDLYKSASTNEGA